MPVRGDRLDQQVCPFDKPKAGITKAALSLRIIMVGVKPALAFMSWHLCGLPAEHNRDKNRDKRGVKPGPTAASPVQLSIITISLKPLQTDQI